MGRRKWKLYQDAVLKTPLKVDVEDWKPRDKCCMCDGRAFLDSATVSTRHIFGKFKDDKIACDVTILVLELCAKHRKACCSYSK